MFTVHVVYQLMMEKREEGRGREGFCRRANAHGRWLDALVCQRRTGETVAWHWVFFRVRVGQRKWSARGWEIEISCSMRVHVDQRVMNYATEHHSRAQRRCVGGLHACISVYTSTHPSIDIP
jgi:hypothetical protein